MIRVVSDRLGRGPFRLEEIDAIPLLLGLASHVTLTVTTWSMFPTIHRGDRLEIGPAEHLRVGDVVLFRRGPGLVCHRVRGIGAGGDVRVRGDASPGPGEPLGPNDVVGTVTAIIRGGVRRSPPRVPRPSASARLRRAVDQVTVQSGACVIAWGRRLCRGRAVRWAARKLLPRLVRLDLALHVPLRCLSGVRVVPLGRAPVDDRVAGLRLERLRWEEVTLLVRVGPCRLATYHPASGAMTVRGAATGLGLEDLLSEQAVRIRRLFGP